MEAHSIRLSFLILLFVSTSSAAASSSEKVTLGLYYETLCPYCSNFIVNYLVKLFESDSDLASITDLKLIPYGNAKIKPNGTIVCQHGTYECILNTVEACAIDAWPDVKDHFPFIYCVEELVYQHNYTYWKTCFGKLNLDPSPVSTCYDSARGNELELKYAAQTNSLKPPHKYVPWVVVDGQPLYDDYRDFARYICEAYKGSPKPSACAEEPSYMGFIRKAITSLISYLYG